MLVTRRDGCLVLVRQPDHAALAGALAEHWGNHRFTTPAAREALICAAAHHDDGWLELDGQPMFNREQARPAHFVELALTDTAAPYGRGVESVYERDQLAGVLASMHFSGFYTSRWGVGGGGQSDNPLALEVVAAQEARWMPALRRAWGNRGRRSEFDAHTWHAYEVLQALDLLSLALCALDLEVPSVGEPLDTTSTLAKVKQPAGGRLVSGVPLAAGGPYETLTVAVGSPGVVTVDPFPFGETSFEIVVRRRELEDRRYADAQDAASAFADADVRVAAGNPSAALSSGTMQYVTNPHRPPGSAAFCMQGSAFATNPDRPRGSVTSSRSIP